MLWISVNRTDYFSHVRARRLSPAGRRVRLLWTTEEGPVSEANKPHQSRSVEAAAARWGEQHPDEDVDHPAPDIVPEDDRVVPNHHSASAEAASLRWREQHEEEDE